MAQPNEATAGDLHSFVATSIILCTFAGGKENCSFPDIMNKKERYAYLVD